MNPELAVLRVMAKNRGIYWMRDIVGLLSEVDERNDDIYLDNIRLMAIES